MVLSVLAAIMASAKRSISGGRRECLRTVFLSVTMVAVDYFLVLRCPSKAAGNQLLPKRSCIHSYFQQYIIIYPLFEVLARANCKHMEATVNEH